ncbi:MAG: hypothetical protein WBC78_14850, partial [Candidatus Sulfotelmatobacter sp.]
SYRERKTTNRVRSGAFQLREEDAADGLSVGLTPEGAVKHCGPTTDTVQYPLRKSMRCPMA